MTLVLSGKYRHGDIMKFYISCVGSVETSQEKEKKEGTYTRLFVCISLLYT